MNGSGYPILQRLSGCDFTLIHGLLHLKKMNTKEGGNDFVMMKQKEIRVSEGEAGL